MLSFLTGMRLFSIFPQFRRGKISADSLSACIGELQSFQTLLPRIAGEIGSRYLKSSSVLAPLIESSESLVASCEALLSQAAAQSDATATGTERLLRPAFDFLDDWRTAIQQASVELAECAGAFSRIQRSEVTLRELMSPLAQMQTMFRIESATLSEDVRQIFTALSSEIEFVQGEVRGTFGRQFEIVYGMLNTLSQVKTRITDQSAQIAAALCAHAQHVVASLSRLKAELARNAEHGAELRRVSSDTKAAVDRMIVALQVHDIVSQRLESVRASISQARSLMTCKAEALQQAWLLTGVQRAQVEGVRHLLIDAESTLQSGGSSIAANTEGLGNENHLIQQLEDVATASNSSADLSLQTIAEARELLESAVACSRDFLQSLEPLTGVTNQLSGVLAQLAHQMRLIALNAQLQAVQIGSGTGLEILAAQTAAVSRETSALAESMSTNISHVVSIVEALTYSLHRTVEHGQSVRQSLQQQSSAPERQLQDQKTQTAEKLRLISEATASIRSCSSLLADEVANREATLSLTDGALSTLARIEAIFQGCLGRLRLTTPPPFESSNYHMKEQRDIHHAALQRLTGQTITGQDPTAKSPVPSAETSASETDLQVELF